MSKFFPVVRVCTEKAFESEKCPALGMAAPHDIAVDSWIGEDGTVLIFKKCKHCGVILIAAELTL